MTAAPRVFAMMKSWDIRNGTTGSMTLEAARLAEQIGLDGLVAGDHVTFYGYGNDGLITLTAIAAVTERIALRTNVYLLPLRHPVPVALQVAQLDQLSMGRFELGVGIGGEDPHEFTSCGVDPRTRGARANEALEILRQVWREDHVSFEGKHFQLDDVTMYPKPWRPVPIFVGGRSDAALVRAGRFGDGYTGLWQSTARFSQAQEVIAEAAAVAGRAEEPFEPGMAFWCSVSDDRAEARALVAGGMESTYQLPFERFEKYTPYGTVREVAEFVAPFVEAGARHIILMPVHDSPEAVVERSAEVQAELRSMFPGE